VGAVDGVVTGRRAEELGEGGLVMDNSYKSQQWQFIAALGWFFAILFGLVFFLQGSADGIEGFLRKYTGIAVSLGTLAIVGVLAMATTVMANQAAARRERFNQKMQALIKISEFRQDWIDRVRDDMAELQLGFFKLSPERKPKRDLTDVLVPLQRLRLSLNPNEDPTKDFEKAISGITDPDKTLTKSEFVNQLGRINSAGARILKEEWEALKRHLEEAQTISASL
jgi:hypothetical protein